MKKIMKKAAAVLMTAVLAAGMSACAAAPDVTVSGSTSGMAQEAKEAVTTFRVGILSFVDDPSLDSMVKSIEERLDALGKQNNVKFDFSYDNCNEDPETLNRIVADFDTNGIDLMIGVATPVAMTMQSIAQGRNIPVVFAAISDDEGGYLDTNDILNILFAYLPDEEEVGVLYEMGEDYSKAGVDAATDYLDSTGIDYETIGIETANMVNDILVNGTVPSSIPLLTFDENQAATVNKEICDMLGLDYETVKEIYETVGPNISELTSSGGFN